VKAIAVTNYKGGSAKTTTAVNLAAALGELGLSVLVVDIDPQASATAWLGAVDPGRHILDAYLGKESILNLVVPTSAPGVDLVPSSQWLVASGREQESDIALGMIRGIEQLPPRWDYVLVDCPPSQGYLAIAPLTVCSEVLVPVEAHLLALSGVVSLADTMNLVRDQLNPGLTLGAIVACRVSRTRHARWVVERLRKLYPAFMLSAVVRENISLAEAPVVQLPITRYAPSSTGADDYRAVAHELLGRQGIVREAPPRGLSLRRLFRSAPRELVGSAAWPVEQASGSQGPHGAT
jgi:chromosome partitioning protein